jgi:2-polyprenyl-3-methyl-5-hydroxy-6-metoxy-1,4-benzoquinol methylase
MGTSSIISSLSQKTARVLREYHSEALAEEWQYHYGISYSDLFASKTVIYHCLCPESRYEFFYPYSLAGGAAFYAELCKRPWYYMADKWEHKKTLELINEWTAKNLSVLEVGCGAGAFLEMCSGRVQTSGIELNPAAVEKAKARGLNVEVADVGELAKSERGRYNMVASFQVLEHIAEPRAFLQHCVDLLADEGLLVISAPNGYSHFGRMSYKANILNYPPHHMGHWNAAAFQYLTCIFPLEMVDMYYEPLQAYHVNWLVRELLRADPSRDSTAARCLRKWVASIVSSYMIKYNTFKNWEGHTLMAVFRKKNVGG